MKRINSACIVILYMAAVLAVAGSDKNRHKLSGLTVASVSVIMEPKMGDSKIMKDKIIAGTNGHMIIFNFDGSLFCEYHDIPLNWLYVYEPENLVVAGNSQNEIRLIEFYDDWTVKTNQTVNIGGESAGILKIDPTIMKAGDTYILTYVDIQGRVNNEDVEAENGIYTVKCMKSKDCRHWTELADIISCQNNIEDADMVYEEQEQVLYYFFEKEQYDKGPSAIHVIVSKDIGQTWEDETELIPAVADHELASVNVTGHGYEVYYSSDKDAVGMSYEGAKIYRAVFDRKFELEDMEQLDVGEDKGILLYDTKSVKDGVCFLYVQNYVTENCLVLKRCRLHLFR